MSRTEYTCTVHYTGVIVRVLKELVRDLTDAHIPSVAPVILPDIYR